MKLQGTLHYDPVTRASGAKRLATLRKYSNILAALASACRPYLQGKLLRKANMIAKTTEDPYCYYVGKTRAPVKADVEFVWAVANSIAEINTGFREIHLLKQVVAEVDSKLILNNNNQGWAILVVQSPQIKNKLKSLRSQGIHISGSLWGPHVSVVRGERVNNAWKRYENHVFEIEVNLDETKQNKQGYYWYGCQSRQLEIIRLELGLPPRPSIPFHLTIGKAQ